MKQAMTPRAIGLGIGAVLVASLPFWAGDQYQLHLAALIAVYWILIAGLNLTRADTVIHYDPWWNPAVEAQASARAHRIGQEKPVMVYKLVARGTLEEAIGKMQEEKRVLTGAALEDGGLTHLAPADLETLYRSIV